MKRYLFIISFLLFFFTASLAQSKEASIDKVFVGKKPNLNLSFVMQDAFKEELDEGIKSGIPTTFTFYVELYRVKRLWFDADSERWTFSHTVKYDNLKEEYVVTLEEQGRTIRTKDIEEMKRLMVTGDTIVLHPKRPLKEGKRYLVRVMAQLDTLKLPFMLRHMLFFVKFWAFKTHWANFRMIY